MRIKPSILFLILVVLLGIIIVSLIFGHFEKGVSADRAAAMKLIQKTGPLSDLLAVCALEKNVDFYKCDKLSQTLESITTEQDEKVIVTTTGEVVGVNFDKRVVVVLKPRLDSEGHITTSCLVQPESASPMGCRLKK